jgi:hypothetical protein
MKNLSLLWATLSLLGALSCLPAHAAGPDLGQARKLLESGKPKDAYALLAPHEFDMAGQRDYDYLLGVAALDGGFPDKATLAFERVLAIDPNSAGARLDMARAYFALGSFDRARQELLVVQKQNPPPVARAVIDRYLEAIAVRERASTTSITGYVEAAVGYDNNITSVVSDFSNAVLATYNLAGFRPTGSSVLRSSPVFATGAGIDINHQLGRNWGLYTGADWRHRSLTSHQQYSSDQIDLRAGAAYTVNRNSWRGGVTVQQYSQLTDLPTADRSAWGLNGEWRHTPSERDQFNVFGSWSSQRYPDIPTSDVNVLLAGGGWMHLFQGNKKPLLYASLYASHDAAVNRLITGSDNSRRSLGARVYGQISTSETLDWFVNTGLLRREDLSANARSSVVEHGRDDILDLSLGMSWRPVKHWVVRPQVTYSSNRSNVALSEFSRTEGSVTVRYEFR